MKFDFRVFENLFNKAGLYAQLLDDYIKAEGHLDKETADLLVKTVKNLKGYVDENASENPTAVYTSTESIGMMFYMVNPYDRSSCFACLSCTSEQAKQHSRTFALCCRYFSLCEVYNLFNTYFNLERTREQED